MADLCNKCVSNEVMQSTDEPITRSQMQTKATDSAHLSSDFSSMSAGSMSAADLESRLSQIQATVGEMKAEFRAAVDMLLRIRSGDEASLEKVGGDPLRPERELAQVTQMILALKNEFNGVVNRLHVANVRQRSLQQQIDTIRSERDALLDELKRAGVALHRDHIVFGDEPSTDCDAESRYMLPSRLSVGDQDSGVQSCLAASVGDGSTLEQAARRSTVDPDIADPTEPAAVEVEVEETDAYDNDDDCVSSSLTAIANKSLDMSRSLTEKCTKMADLESRDVPSDEGEADGMVCESMVDATQKSQPDSRSANKKRLYRTRHKSSECRSPSVPSRNPLTVCSPVNGKHSKEAFRCRVAREIVDTERKYCSCLWTLVNHFVLSLRQSDIVSVDDIDVMFPPCLVKIYELHCAFLHRLESRLTETAATVGDIFDSFIPSSSCPLLAEYQLYVNVFPKGLVTLRKMSRHNPGFRKILKGLELHPCCEGLEVSAFLLTPIQRMPRYVLLLKQLIKYTEPCHVDFACVEQCLSRLGDFLSRLNDSIEQSMLAMTTAPDVSPPKQQQQRRRFQLNGFSFRSISLDASVNEQRSSNPAAIRDPLRRPEFRVPPSDALTRRRIIPTTSTPIGGRTQPLRAVHRGPTFHGFEAEPPSERLHRRLQRNSRGSEINISVNSNGDANAIQHDLFAGDSEPQIGDRRADSGHANLSKISMDCQDNVKSPATESRADIAGSMGLITSITDQCLSDETVRLRVSPSVPDVSRINRHSVNSLFGSFRDDRGQSLPGKGFNFLRNMTRKKTTGLTASTESTFTSENDASMITLKHKTSLRDSLKKLFVRKRSNDGGNFGTSADATICSLPPAMASSSRVQPLKPRN